MSQMDTLVGALKRSLRSQGITYRDIARELALSESSVKRCFAQNRFSMARFESICRIAGLEVFDLVDLANAERPQISELTREQEQQLVDDPKLLLLAYLLITGWEMDEILANYDIEREEASRMLVRLHRARIVELLPLERVRLLTSRNFKWRRNGPIQRFFREQVQREFFDSTFAEEGARLRFVGGPLTMASMQQMHRSLDRVAEEFNELSRRDAAVPVEQRSGCSAVFAIRPWDFSVFEQFRRS